MDLTLFMAGFLFRNNIIADSHGTATSWQHGALYPPKGIYTVCRCGESKNKPFCDSSHYPEAEDVEKVHNK
jgi:CDGSH-type Zn-finger protein